MNLVPKKDPNFVPFGLHKAIRAIVKSKNFYPIYIEGPSGNGKTTSSLQACAETGRECLRVNFTNLTDDTYLFGGWQLIKGDTEFVYGPVIQAMERGAVLILDEVNQMTAKAMCLQPVLEGSPVLVPQTNEVIYPKKGFTVIATANTKGRGDETGKFVGDQYLNEAFLDRFCITVEQWFPEPEHEKKILYGLAKRYRVRNAPYIDALLEWAAQIRRAYKNGAQDELISTRRLVHIVKTYAIFKNEKTAIQLCLNRFDEQTKMSFMELFQNHYSFSVNGPKKGKVDKKDKEKNFEASLDDDRNLNEVMQALK